MRTNDQFKDKTSGHIGVLWVDKSGVSVMCTNCSIETQGKTGNQAKKSFIKEHKNDI